MAGKDDFIGLQMVVTLRSPHDRLCGSISGVQAGQSLTLTNVWSLESGQWQPQIILDPNNIVDIVDASKESFPPGTRQPAQPPAAPLADPAILSFKPRPRPQASRPAADGQVQATASEKEVPGPAQLPTLRVTRPSTPTTVAGMVPDEEGLGDPNSPSTAHVAASEPPTHHGPDTTQKKKRRQRSRQTRNAMPDEAADVSPKDGSKGAGRGKGWRQTPILQSTASFQPFNALKRAGRGRPSANQDHSGWASEDVTDVQEMGDFDFEGSLAKFDKRTLFDQMKKEDRVDTAERLVAHNRQPRNLHYSENVLDVPTSTASKGPAKEPQVVGQDFWNSEADDGIAHSGERLSGREHGSRQSSRRGESKMSTSRRSQSRKASATTSIQGPARVNSGQLSGAASAPGFYLLPSKRRIETVSALQMLNLENIAHNELGLTENMMTENAGRGIAEVALTTLADPAIRVRTSTSAGPNHSPPPTVVILAGNNKSGIRAVAAGRHLRNKGAAVLICVVGIERGERELLEDLRQQIHLFRNFGGRIYSKSELFEHLRKASIPTLTIDTPRSAITANKPPTVTLIVDALLGLAISFDELRTGDQATVYELIEWANRNEAFVLAVDVPTGVDPSTGKVSIIDGNRLYVHPRWVVSVGCPKVGLLLAISGGEVGENTAATSVTASDDSASDWKLFVTDIGLGPAVWKKAGTKVRRGIDFDDKWVLEMRYHAAPDADNEERGRG